MNHITNSPLHLAIIRAFPQSDFHARSTEVLSKFKEGEPIKASGLDTEERKVLWDLSTAGLIETRRYPIRTNGMFAGFATSYVYSVELEYGGETKAEKNGAWYWILLGLSIGVSISSIIISNAIKTL